MSDDTKTRMEYIGKRWRSTEPGLRWAYIFSIVSNTLIIRFLSYNLLSPENLLIPITIFSWLQGGLRIRLIWIGFLLYATIIFFRRAYLNFVILGVVFNNIYTYIYIGIGLSIISIALVRGLFSFDLRKTSEDFFKKSYMRGFSILFVLIILSHLGDFYCHEYLKESKSIYSSMFTVSLVHPYIMIFIYAILALLTEIKYFLGAIYSPIILIADTIFRTYGLVNKINRIALTQFVMEFEHLNLSSSLKILIAGKVFLGLILPILSILLILHFLIKISDTVFPGKVKL